MFGETDMLRALCRFLMKNLFKKNLTVLPWIVSGDIIYYKLEDLTIIVHIIVWKSIRYARYKGFLRVSGFLIKTIIPQIRIYFGQNCKSTSPILLYLIIPGLSVSDMLRFQGTGEQFYY